MDNIHYLFTSESVSEGHPDKLCDQIADRILDAYLEANKNSFVAIECFATTDTLIIGGEVNPINENIDIEKIARDTIKSIGYDKDEYGFNYKTVKIINLVKGQSSNIRQGVENSNYLLQGAGDQGIMFGYASDESEGYMPLPISIAHKLVRTATKLRKEGKFKHARPDMKSQVTIDYFNDEKRIDTILMSVQHDEDIDIDEFKEYIKNEIMIPVAKSFNLNTDFKVLINPTGKFVIGGPQGDAGLTGRKIIVDTYGGSCPHGGGAFSGKDPSKVDRSGAYAMRYVAKNLVASGICDKATIQIAYAIGVVEPVCILVNTHGTGKFEDSKIEECVKQVFRLTPRGIIESLDLLRPIYQKTASYGHFGRELPEFTWEKTDKAEAIKDYFNLK